MMWSRSACCAAAAFSAATNSACVAVTTDSANGSRAFTFAA